jgi:hypothetical protein
MFEFQYNINARSTAQRYIESCTTLDHIKTMEKYIELYKEKFDDFLGHHTLELDLECKSEFIINNNK